MTDDPLPILTSTQIERKPLDIIAVENGPSAEEVRAVLRTIKTRTTPYYFTGPPNIASDFVGDAPDAVRRRDRLFTCIEGVCAAGALFDFPGERTSVDIDLPDFSTLRAPYDRCIFLFRARVSNRSPAMATHIMVVSADADGRPIEIVLLFWTRTVADPYPTLALSMICTLEYEGDNTYLRPYQSIRDTTEDDEPVTQWGALWLRYMLTVLNDNRSRPVRVPAPHRLNKVRAKKGKRPLPSYWTVNSAEYVTIVKAAHAAKHGEGKGTHASPRPHMRRAHSRRLDDGRIVWVRSTTVNDFTPHLTRGREFYSVKV